ncbi:cysteine--tRNA ligase [Blattabacterium cuenoti]|uniref:cysteine--tRNA ligase n=1 Tax=Blattabacterium cuenoti TaxID=1653831 RepID=UPI00163BFAEC|nr:cysteine--tRNA ligase [Blattabacterium cuenoti]
MDKISDIKKNLKIYNSLTGKKELFIPINKDYVGIYVCGPTVYNHLHLGNCRTFISFDLVFRYLKHLGYKVRYVRNITDVGHLESDLEDKIFKKSRLEGLEPMEIVQKYTLSFHNLLSILNVQPPSIEPRATGHIIEQIDMIQKLIKKKLAYEMNGSVYFNLKEYEKFYPYGILSKNKTNQLVNKKFKITIVEKKNPQDFSLWKKASSNHIMSWNSPWGKGFPGWHIECTVMSTKYLGETFDIHGGGIDLKFPHHECELAQSIGAYNRKSLAHYWMHTNMLTLNGKKMSKSTGNSLGINDIYSFCEKKSFSPNIFRFFILKSHYRSVMNFTKKGLIHAEKEYTKIIESINILENFNSKTLKEKNNDNFFKIFFWIKKCYESINDDFNTPLLISNLFKVSHIIRHNINEIEKCHINLLKKYMTHFVFDILGLKKEEEQKTKSSSLSDNRLSILIERLIKFRMEARKQKNWILSDRIRKELSHIGVKLHDEKLF